MYQCNIFLTRSDVTLHEITNTIDQVAVLVKSTGEGTGWLRGLIAAEEAFHLQVTSLNVGQASSDLKSLPLTGDLCEMT